MNAQDYHPIHPQLSEVNDSYLSTWRDKYVCSQLIQREFELICDEPIDNVFIFPVFTPLFCKEVIEEAENYGQWEMDRHKNYPTNDMLLEALGVNTNYTWVIQNYILPLLIYKYKLESKWLHLNSENFIARYLPGKQQHLGLHYDASYLSLILTLNNEFEGGGTFSPNSKN
jgi:hypothetical protein